MNQLDKELVIMDLCARAAYGVKIKIRSNDIRTVRSIDPIDGIVTFVETDTISPFGLHIEHPTTLRQVVKPYLRPISSMTEDEVKELIKVHLSRYSKESDYNEHFIEIVRIRKQSDDSWSAWLRFGEGDDIHTTCFIVGKVNWETTLKEIDWLLAHHFDIRGLIPKGLALKATEGMY